MKRLARANIQNIKKVPLPRTMTMIRCVSNERGFSLVASLIGLTLIGVCIFIYHGHSVNMVNAMSQSKIKNSRSLLIVNLTTLGRLMNDHTKSKLTLAGSNCVNASTAAPPADADCNTTIIPTLPYGPSEKWYSSEVDSSDNAIQISGTEHPDDPIYYNLDGDIYDISCNSNNCPGFAVTSYVQFTCANNDSSCDVAEGAKVTFKVKPHNLSDTSLSERKVRIPVDLNITTPTP